MLEYTGKLMGFNLFIVFCDRSIPLITSFLSRRVVMLWGAALASCFFVSFSHAQQVDALSETAKEGKQTQEVEVLPLQKVYRAEDGETKAPAWFSELEANDLGKQFKELPMPKGMEIFRRTEAVFLISVPFAIFYSYLLKNSFSYISAMGSASEGGGLGIQPQNFNYSHDYFLKSTVDPFYAFTWTNNIVWPLAITLNHILDRNLPASFVERKKEKMPEARFDNDLLLYEF